MPMDRRSVLKGASGIAAASTLSGCLGFLGGGGGGNRGDAMLWHQMTGSEIETFEASLETYNEENDAEIVAEETGDLRNQVETTLSGGDGPEMYRWAQDWAGGHYERDFLYDASDDISFNIEEKFSEATVEAITVDGGNAVVGLPVAGETVGLLYNKDMVDSPPQTFAEMEEIMASHYDPNNGKYGLSSPINAYFASPWLHAFGGYYFQVNDNGEPETGMELEETKRGMQFLKDHIWAYIPEDVTYEPQAQVFQNSNAPFAINGPWAIGTFQNNDINVGVAPFPEMEGGTATPYTGTSMWYFTARMGDDEDRRDSALSYAEWISTSAERQQAYAKAHSSIPVLSSIDTSSLSEGVTQFQSIYDAGIAMPNHPGMSDVWTPVEDAMNAVLLDGADISSRFDEAAQEIRDSWAE